MRKSPTSSSWRPSSSKAWTAWVRELDTRGIPVIVSNYFPEEEAYRYILAWCGPDAWGQFRMLSRTFADLMGHEGGYAIIRHIPGSSCYDARAWCWLERWGLVYYGCCEPLDRKIPLLRRIPNLRKFSMSPWNNFAKVIDEVQGDYVLSFKPSPAIFVDENWNPEKVRAALKNVLDRAKGVSHVEVIMKDISTVLHKPQRLWDWARIAMEVAQENA